MKKHPNSAGMPGFTYFSCGLVLVCLLAGCKKTEENPVSATGGGAYLRFTVLYDVPPGSDGVRFYFDGVLNVNGDSLVKSPNGTVFAQPTRTYAPAFPNGDYTGPTVAGVYSYDLYKSYFPNSTHRVPLAPVIGDYNYYKYADVASGVHQFTVRPVFIRSISGRVTEILEKNIADAPLLFEKGVLHTVTLVKSSIENADFNLVTLKDHPDSVRLKDSTAYIRFVNVTPAYSNQDVNVNTNSVDLYLVKTRDSVSTPEILIQSNLNRFQSSIDLPFAELDMRAEMKDSIPINLSPTPQSGIRVPYSLTKSIYTVRVYRKGESAANRDAYIAEFRLDFNVPLLVQDPSNRFQATRNTIYLRLEPQASFLLGVKCTSLAFERKDADGGYFTK
jgi:hypothetical protein